MQDPALTPGQAKTAKAREAVLRRATNRALDDPVALERAARIMRAAIARGLYNPDLTAKQVTP